VRGSWKIGTIKGIGIYLHWTFAVLIGWVFLSGVLGGASAGATVATLVFLAAVFGCVVLHELGHALTARRFGIGTRDITLLPIGGVANLERMPERPLQELLVSLAGPAVNVVIAAGLFVLIGLFGRSALLVNLLYVNLIMVIFNLLPAFPMDGGRVLRAFLTMRAGFLRATETAVKVGKFVAIVLGVIGLFSNVMLAFIALFVYFGADQELQMARAKAMYGYNGWQPSTWGRVEVFPPEARPRPDAWPPFPPRSHGARGDNVVVLREGPEIVVHRRPLAE
jgi:Zn-dependent protease